MEPTDSAAQPMQQLTKLCFICFGNICRSPAFAAVLEDLAEKRGLSDHFFIDSMALTTYYIGRPADLRMRHAAEKKNINIDHIAKLFKPTDFQRFDAVFAATSDAAEILRDLAPPEEQHKILLATAYSKKFKNQDVPDPYYDGEKTFDLVMEMAFDACEGILDHYFPTR